MSNAVANGLAGAGGGMIAQIITYPLQTVNTRQQTERVAKKSLANSKRLGTLVQILQVIRSDGWGGLYSGLKPSLLGTAASQVFKNKAEAIAVARKAKGHGDGTVGMFSWLLVAALAGSLNVLLTNPIWVLVTRMQTHTQAERKIMEERKEALVKEASENSLTGSELQVKLAELDSIKPHPYGTWQASRLQAKQEIGGNISLRYSGTVDAIRKMIQYEGLPGFYKGMSTKIAQSVFAASVLFMVKEELLKIYTLLADKCNKVLLSSAK
ncbi:hypothetical protein PRUPE_5G000200 [Prunus persica]|uniref:Peroxisomal nicotinamide adenine dinucleotide carrier n=1 Tax=Prunus persica TaxID=3760 RepID=A0A251P109_PRUPE|nr:hypothetical protein PRUPE_5G000200 [Prunus persica]